MTDREKLDKAVEFIKKIQNLDLPVRDIRDYVSIVGECGECGSSDIDISIRGDGATLDPDCLEDIRDRAWHVLADIEEL